MSGPGVTLAVRRATAPGVLYPAEGSALTRTVDGLLEAAAPQHPMLAEGVPKAIIVPHDAYEFSGPTAAAAYSRLRPWRHAVKTVVVVGPRRGSGPPGVALTSAGAFETPLGRVSVDQDVCAELMSMAGVRIDDDAHAEEHRVEVQLPFLQRVLPHDWTLVPALCSGLDPSDMADLLQPLCDRPGTLVVVSSDLSSEWDQTTATFNDRRTAAAIVARWWEALGERDVSCAAAVRGLLEFARRRGLAVTQLSLATSADAGGSPEQVVGYGSFILR